MNEIEIICNLVIGAIKNCPPSQLDHRFRNFPHGCCGLGTELIGTYLYKNGFGTFYYINTQHGKNNEKSHAWAQQNEIIVDLTIAQFTDAPNSHIVINEKDSIWHKQFNRTGKTRPILLTEENDFKGQPIYPFYLYIESQLNRV